MANTKKIHRLKIVPLKTFYLFLFLLVLENVIYLTLTVAVIGWNNFVEMMPLVVPVGVFFLAGSLLLLWHKNTKTLELIRDLLENVTDIRVSGTHVKEIARRLDDKGLPVGFIREKINNYAWHISLHLFFTTAILPVTLILAGFYLHLFFSWQQALFIFAVGELLGLGAAYILFYNVQPWLYPVNRILEFKPLSILNKFSIPVLTTLTLMLAILSASVYLIFQYKIMSDQNLIVKEKLGRAKNEINHFVSQPLREIRSYARMGLFKNMNLQIVGEQLKKFHSNKSPNVDYYFVADHLGNAVTSLGTKADIYDRAYFHRVKDSRNYYFSEPTKSRFSGKQIFTITEPIFGQNGKFVGVIGVAVKLKTVFAVLKKIKYNSPVQFVLLSSLNKIISHSVPVVNSTDGYNIMDDQKLIDNINSVLIASDYEKKMVKMGWHRYISYKIQDDVSEYSLALMVRQKKILQALNPILLIITLGSVAMIILLYFIIQRITLFTAQPIQKTIHVLQKVQDLKFQQDADYFLTSLLIDPLARMHGDQKPVILDAFAEQKKQFEFNNKRGEIGGDLNISDTIELQKKEYIAFLNGDAMGKSLQGASGALTLGVVFNSFVTRTKRIKQQRKKSPEQWIKDCYSDMQSVFETFDGSMMASIVMGLVERQSGVVYYVNAEHPWPVLYRNGKAQFISSDIVLYKVGNVLQLHPFMIHTFALRKGDSFFVGSDGKDDIILGYEEDGTRIINEDEELFLQHVEQGEGQLDRIAESIKSQGELTDDFTLLSISFEGEGVYDKYHHSKESLDLEDQELFDKAHELEKGKHWGKALDILNKLSHKDKTALPALSRMMRLHLKRQEYSRSAKLGERYYNIDPLNNKIIFLTSFSFKKAKKLSRAVHYGEILRLRDPKNVRNLMNLADAYRLQKNYDRALFLAETGLNYDPHNDKLNSLKEYLGEQMESISYRGSKAQLEKG